MTATNPPDSERLRKVNALLEAALALDEQERPAWLKTLPPEEQSFVPLLATMLARASVETDRFMRGPVGLGLGDIDALEAVADAPGDAVGPYRLIRELGSGGMATVWLAERADGVLHRQVALKLPREGWATGLAQRMARERDILGALEHPRIARLYEAGVTDRGRPWMAMECVSGAPIDQHCSQHVLDVPQRLRLFLQVTEAVSHAHARLIVHRDLKPSNILVTPEGQVRLLDFGVASLLAGVPVGSGSLTQRIGRAVTPDYASPEQVSGAPVTVATDVYSLGVVLYELLTGQRPYRIGNRSAAGLEEAILAAEVPIASATVRGNRALARRLRGDIDTILAKALSKRAPLRYASVEAFAADVQRHLDGEPVLARRPSRFYRALKFLRRHQVAFAALTAVATSLLIGLSAAWWQAGEARAEAARAEQVKEFVASIFRQATPRAGVGGAVTASDLLAAAAERIEQELANQPSVAAELGVIVGQGFFSLGQAAKGEAALRAAVARADRVLGRVHPITLQAKALLVESLGYDDLALAERLLAELVPDALAGLPATAQGAVFGLRSQSWVLAMRGQSEASYAAARRAIGISEQQLGPGHADTIRTLGLFATIQGRFGAHREQLATAAEARFRAEEAYGNRRPHPILASIERWYGEALLRNGRPAEATTFLERALSEQRSLDAAETARVLQALLLLAEATADSGRLSQALPLMREAVALEAKLRGAAQPTTEVRSGVELVRQLMHLRRAEEALALHVELLATPLSEVEQPTRLRLQAEAYRARLLALNGDKTAPRVAVAAAERAGDAHPTVRAEARLATALAARLQGRPTEALEFAQLVVGDPGAAEFPEALRADAHAEAASAWLDLGESERAAQALEHSRAAFAAAQVGPTLRLSDVIVGEARVLLLAGRAEQAEALLQPLVAAWRDADPGSHWHGQSLHWLARAQAMRGRTSEALATRRAAAALLQGSRLPALARLAER